MELQKTHLRKAQTAVQITAAVKKSQQQQRMEALKIQILLQMEQQKMQMVPQDVASKLSKKVLETYIKVLNDAGASYVPADTDKYFSAELNVLDKEMKTVFSIDTEIADDDLLVNVDAEVRQKLYDDTMKFFANLYGETTSEDSSTDTAEAGTDENTEAYSEDGTTEETY